MRTRVTHRVFRLLRGSRGTSLIEAAVITPLLFLLTFAIVDFASMFYVYLALENGVSLATRFAVTGNVLNDASGAPLSREASIIAAMKDSTPTLNLDSATFSFSHMPTGGAAFIPGAGGPSDIEKVTVGYDWNLMTPLLLPFFPSGKMHFTVDSAMKNEPLFQQ